MSTLWTTSPAWSIWHVASYSFAIYEMRSTLSKAIAHALRHEPEAYGIKLDGDGWVRIDELIAGLLRENPSWNSLSADDIAGMIERSPKRRYELAGDRIRAYYGHSMDERISKDPSEPPEVLYHGTVDSAAESILREGLKPMGRQYVHLSVDPETARQVGLRKGSNLTIFIIDSASAHREGVPFYLGNDAVWLADAVPVRYLKRAQE